MTIFGIELNYVVGSYCAQILISELLFMSSFEKRRYYLLRFIPSCVLLLLLSMLIGLSYGNNLETFIKFFILIFLSILIMIFCYKGKITSILAACTAGIAVQHISSKLHDIFNLAFNVRNMFSDWKLLNIIISFIFLAIVCVPAYFVFVRAATKNRIYKYTNNGLSALSIVIVLTCIGINRFVTKDGTSKEMQFAVDCYAIVCCVFALIIQFSLNLLNKDKTELRLTKRLLNDSGKQYEQWKNSIDLVNIRYHDIKHMLEDLKQTAEGKGIKELNIAPIEQAVSKYSARVRTGNEVLDMVIDNLSVICSNNKIQLSCVASGDAMKEIDGIELYFLFNNAIDNAINSVKKIEDESKRVIDIVIKPFGDSVVIHTWNYYTGTVRFIDGLPVTENNPETHGFGMKSIKMVVERMGGAMQVYTEGEVFHLNIILPVGNK